MIAPLAPRAGALRRGLGPDREGDRWALGGTPASGRHPPRRELRRAPRASDEEWELLTRTASAFLGVAVAVGGSEVCGFVFAAFG